MANVGPSFSVITLNLNFLNSPIKRKSLEEWVKKIHAPTFTVYKSITLEPDTKKWKVKGQNKPFYANGKQKRAGGAELVSDKMDYTSNRYHETNKTLCIDKRVLEDFTLI